MIQRLDDLEDLVFAFYGESQDIEFVRDRCAAHPKVSDGLDVPTLFGRIQTLDDVDVEGFIEAMRYEPSVVGRSLMLFFWTYQRQVSGLDPRDLATLRAEASTQLTRLDHLYLEFLRLTTLPAGAIEPTERLLVEVQELGGVKADLIASFIRCWLGATAMQLEQLDEAREHFEVARELCVQHRFLTLLMVVWRLGALRWQAGEPVEALGIHRDHAARTLARRFDKGGWLLQSHASAAKCGLDAHELETAREEIEEAEQLIARSEVALNVIAIANLRHFKGQYLFRVGDVDAAKESVRDALQLYRDHNVVRGAMEANVTLAEFALECGEYDVLGTQITGLIRAAESSEYRDLHGRLLAIRTRLGALGAGVDE
ncbi:MAG: hypothetical protein AAF488_17130 [Planctomycetota bacterium]